MRGGSRIGVLAGGHGVERGAGQAPGGADPTASAARPDLACRARWRQSSPRSRRPKGPKVSVLTRLQQFHLHRINSPIRLPMAAIQFRLHRHRHCVARARRSIPPDRFLTPLARAGRSSVTPNWPRQQSCAGSAAKAAPSTSRLARSPSIASSKSQRAWVFRPLSTSRSESTVPRRPTTTQSQARSRHSSPNEGPSTRCNFIMPTCIEFIAGWQARRRARATARKACCGD